MSAHFFLTAGLRGICEDIIALKFVAQFSKAIRQELMLLEMSVSVRKAIDAAASGDSAIRNENLLQVLPLRKSNVRTPSVLPNV